MNHKTRSSSNKVLFSLIIVIACSFLALGLLSSKLFLMALYLLLPTVIAIVTDKSSDKCFSLCVGCCNISALLIHCPLLLRQDVDMRLLLNIFKVNELSFIYAASFCGLILYFVMPRLISAIYEIMLRMHKAKLHAKLRELSSTWEL